MCRVIVVVVLYCLISLMLSLFRVCMYVGTHFGTVASSSHWKILNGTAA